MHQLSSGAQDSCLVSKVTFNRAFAFLQSISGIILPCAFLDQFCFRDHVRMLHRWIRIRTVFVLCIFIICLQGLQKPPNEWLKYSIMDHRDNFSLSQLCLRTSSYEDLVALCAFVLTCHAYEPSYSQNQKFSEKLSHSS